MKHFDVSLLGKNRSKLGNLFGIISLLFFLFFIASQLYQIKTFKNILTAQYRQTMSVLAELVVYQTYDKMKNIFEDSAAITLRLEGIHQSFMETLDEHPEKTLVQLKYQSPEKDSLELYRFDENMTIIETTYPPDQGLNLSFLKDYFEERRAKKTIDVTRYPVYEPLDGNYMFYSMVYRPQKHDFLQLSWRESYDPKLVQFHRYLNRIPSVKNVEVFVYDSQINQMKGMYRYFKDGAVKSKKEYVALYLRHEMDVTKFYFQNSILPSHTHMQYHSDTKELIYDKLLQSDGTYPRTVVRVVFDAKSYEDQISKTYLTHGIWLFGTVIFILIILYVLRKRIIFPVTQMAYNVYQKNSLPLELIHHNDEIGDIARAYNQALQDLSKEIEYSNQLLENQDKFIRTSIHEINTPLTIISLYSEFLQMEIGENPNTRQIEAGVRLLKNTFEDLSYLIKRETQPIVPHGIDLNLFVQERIEFFSLIAEVNTKTIVLNSNKSHIVVMDAIQLQRLIDNTLSNAIKYSALNSTVTVEIKEDRSDVILSVSNIGEMIIDTQKIFEMYVRENTSKGGYGIGLSIVKEICMDNSIIIDVLSSESLTIFHYIFPKGNR